MAYKYIGPYVTEFNRMIAKINHECIYSCNKFEKYFEVYRTKMSGEGYEICKVFVKTLSFEELISLKRFIDMHSHQIELKEISPKSICAHHDTIVLLTEEIEKRRASLQNTEASLIRALITSKEMELDALKKALIIIEKS